MYKANDDYSITIENLSKMYKIYHKKRDRILDLLNLKLFMDRNSYDEFWALKDVGIKIPKGMKLGILGRNGAGKSTLLKIITGNIKPTNGQITINGKISALLELGTGFHPEFTGRENIYASLAYMGIDQKEAEQRYDDILDFSELEDFIDKPVKTYSAGMYARLAFSVATSIEPEILIIDEVLGAGDTYFVNKCIERMKKLTEGGTTVLFVSHDISSVQKMCTHAIWIDNGKLLMQGDIIDVSKAYLASVRKQEELRLKAENMKLKRNVVKAFENNDSTQLLFHFITQDGEPKEKHPINKISLYKNGVMIDELILGDAMDNDNTRSIFLLTSKGTINWSEPLKYDGRCIRSFENVGGIYKHAVFVVNIVEDSNALDKSNYEIEIGYKDVTNEKVILELYNGQSYVKIGELQNINDGKWKKSKCSIDSIYLGYKNKEVVKEESHKTVNVKNNNIIKEKSLDKIDRNTNDIYGSGEIIIGDVKFLDENEVPKYTFITGEKMICRISYIASQNIINPVFVVALYKYDGTCISQLISNKDNFIIDKLNGRGSVDVIFDPLLIGRGEYIISIAIFKELNLLDAAEPEAYDLHDRKYKLKIEQPFGINTELGQINHPVRWNIRYVE